MFAINPKTPLLLASVCKDHVILTDHRTKPSTCCSHARRGVVALMGDSETQAHHPTPGRHQTLVPS